MRNENWQAVIGKQKGDSVQLVMQGLRWENKTPDRLVEGTITKVTSATYTYTTEGAAREGSIRLGARQYNATEDRGVATIGDKRFEFRIATARDVERLTDPHRELREELTDAVRSVRPQYGHITPEQLAALIADLEVALAAGRKLEAALAE